MLLNILEFSFYRCKLFQFRLLIIPNKVKKRIYITGRSSHSLFIFILFIFHYGFKKIA